MIKHLVLFKFKEGVTDREREGLAYELECLSGVVSQVKSLQVAFDAGRKNNSYDLALDSEFDTMADMECYLAHPAHVKALENVSRLCQSVAKVDYEMAD